VTTLEIVDDGVERKFLELMDALFKVPVRGPRQIADTPQRGHLKLLVARSLQKENQKEKEVRRMKGNEGE